MTITGGFQPLDAGFSVNERAKMICGPRLPEGKTVVPFDQPCELGYVCPVCDYAPIVDGDFDDRLEWSEYRFFLWCRVCNKDYPSALCAPTLEARIKVFLDCIASATAHDYG